MSVDLGHQHPNAIKTVYCLTVLWGRQKSAGVFFGSEARAASSLCWRAVCCLTADLLVKASQLFLQIIDLLQIQISRSGRCLQLNRFLCCRCVSACGHMAGSRMMLILIPLPLVIHCHRFPKAPR